MKKNNNTKKTYTRTSNDFVYNSFAAKKNDKGGVDKSGNDKSNNDKSGNNKGIDDKSGNNKGINDKSSVGISGNEKIGNDKSSIDQSCVDKIGVDKEDTKSTCDHKDTATPENNANIESNGDAVQTNVSDCICNDETEDNNRNKLYGDLYNMYDKIEALMLKFLFEEVGPDDRHKKKYCYNVFSEKTNYDSVCIYDAKTHTQDIDELVRQKNVVKPYRCTIDLYDDTTYTKNQNTTVERLKQTEHLLQYINKVNENKQDKINIRHNKDYRLVGERNGFRPNSTIYELLEMSEPCIESESKNEYQYKIVASQTTANNSPKTAGSVKRDNGSGIQEINEIQDVDCDNKTRKENSNDTR
ncbi:hypothetical protein BDAP_001056 [Binucleata daphniae]